MIVAKDNVDVMFVDMMFTEWIRFVRLRRIYLWKVNQRKETCG